jgi:hypothetical protein
LPVIFAQQIEAAVGVGNGRRVRADSLANPNSIETTSSGNGGFASRGRSCRVKLCLPALSSKLEATMHTGLRYFQALCLCIGLLFSVTPNLAFAQQERALSQAQIEEILKNEPKLQSGFVSKSGANVKVTDIVDGGVAVRFESQGLTGNITVKGGSQVVSVDLVGEIVDGLAKLGAALTTVLTTITTTTTTTTTSCANIIVTGNNNTVNVNGSVCSK